MNYIRTVITVSMALLFALSIAGWIWSGEQPEAVRTGARMVLVPCALMALGSTAIVWTAKGRTRRPDAKEPARESVAQKKTMAAS